MFFESKKVRSVLCGFNELEKLLDGNGGICPQNELIHPIKNFQQHVNVFKRENRKYIEYWRDKYNLGDVFSDYLLESIYDKQALDKIDHRRTMMFIGSEIPFLANNSTLVCGLGWQYRDKHVMDCKNVEGSSFCYVRGKISRNNVIEAGIGISPDLPIGDSGLLASLLYTPSSAKIHDIGIITHWTAKQKLKTYLDTAKKIFPDKDIAIMQMGDETKSPLDLFEFIQSCRVVVASSLHAIIFSHSFGVPALFFSDVDEYKFQDYYSVYDRIHYEDILKWTSLETALEHVSDEQFVQSVNPTKEEVV